MNKNTCYCGRPIQTSGMNICQICRDGTGPGGGGGPGGGPGVMGDEETETSITV